MDNRQFICNVISKMLDNPDEYGIYPTGEAYDALERKMNMKDLQKHLDDSTLEETRNIIAYWYDESKEWEKKAEEEHYNLLYAQQHIEELEAEIKLLEVSKIPNIAEMNRCCETCLFWGTEGENKHSLIDSIAFYRVCTNEYTNCTNEDGSIGVPVGTKVAGDYVCPGWKEIK